MEGCLSKWTNYIYGWQKRHFVLENNSLEYFNKKGGVHKGTIHLNTAIVYPGKNSKRIMISTGCARIYLKASSAVLAKQWVDAMILSQVSSGQKPQTAQERHETIQLHLNSLWGLQNSMEEKLSEVPKKLRDSNPALSEFVNISQSFKRLALDVLNEIVEEHNQLNELQDIESSSIASDYNKENSTPVSPHQSAHEREESIYEDAVSHEDLQEEPYRTHLPVPRDPNKKINIWKVIKDSVGKELSKIAVPVYFNEPLSFLQRLAEELTYNSIIHNACRSQDPCLRLAYVACFAVSAYSPTKHRFMKPFNPLLGETFELQKDGFKLLTEQVSHHPPVSAIHCSHELYSFFGSTEIKNSFKGTHLRLHPSGLYNLQIHSTNDHYVWEKPYTNVHNLIIGKMYVDHYGTFTIKNLKGQEYAEVTMKKKGWFNKEEHCVTGKVFNSEGQLRYSLDGKWSSQVKIKNEITSEEFEGFSEYPYPLKFEQNYFFSEFAMQLNLPPELVPGLVPTDSRLRPDQRALENGNVDLANTEKQRLEDKQRKARKRREEQGVEYTPQWFELQEGQWVYKGGYWEKQNQEDFPDIF